MSDLISKKAVMEELLAIQDVTYMSTCLTVDECKGKRWMIARAIDAVKDAPTVDAEIVRHGHWIMNEDDELYCSACGDIANLNSGEYFYRDKIRFDDSFYCHHCGAKMDEEVSDEVD